MMEGFPTDLVVLMDELSTLEFLKLAHYKLKKITVSSVEELTELDKVLCQSADISSKAKLKMLSPALRERFFKLIAEKGLDKPPSLFSECTNEQALQNQTAPNQKASNPSTFFQNNQQPTLFQNNQQPTLFQNNQQPTLFQNTSRPSDVDPASFQTEQRPPDAQAALFHRVLNVLNQNDPPQSGSPNPQNSEPFNKRTSSFQDVLGSYETEPFEADVSAQSKSTQLKESAPRVPKRQYREQSRSPPAAYKSRSSSRTRGRRSRSPPTTYKSRSSSRPRMTPESSRRSRTPPSSYGSRASYGSRFDSPESARDEAKEPKRDEGSAARKTGLSFSFAPRRKYPGGDKPPVKF